MFGIDDSGLSREDSALPELVLHEMAWPAWFALKEAAANEGIALAPASSYRSFQRQLGIWNAKARGERPVLNSHGEPLDGADLSPKELVFAILRWSALPGLSRHHWGTDLDVIDQNCIAPGYKVQLTVAETCADGPFVKLHRWLDGYLGDAACGFVRPYANDQGGVAPEPWHLSCSRVAAVFEQGLDQETARKVIEQSAADIALSDIILDHFEEIYRRYIHIW